MMKYERKDKFTQPHTIADLLNLGLEKEKSSFEFYKDLIKRAKSENQSLIKVLTKLKDAEWGHMQIIKGMLER